MSGNTAELLRSIDKTLKSLLRLRVAETFEEEATNREKVKVLHQLGFDTAEMADIVGTSKGSIRGTRSDLRSEGEIE